MDRFYPPLDPVTLKNLLVVKRLAAEDPGYLAESSYPNDIFNLVASTEPTTQDLSSEPVNVLAELESVYLQLKLHKPNKEDATAITGYFRTASTLLEKLLDNIERGKNAKQVSDFYRKVIEILDEVCTPSQRTTVQEALKAWSKE